jgi:hypothetical protein
LTWQPQNLYFKKLSVDFDRLLDIMTANALENMGMMFATLDAKSEAKLPCHMLPYGRNPNFFGREKEIESITKTLNKGSSRATREVVLFGIGGVGKTQIALEYAYRQIENGIDAVFWVFSGSSISLVQGFTTIANRLGLIGASVDEHDENRNLVLSWMARTGE